MAPLSGLRTPSPIKSRLPLGSNLPKRTASLKVSSAISLKPLVRRTSIKNPPVVKKPTTSRTELQESIAYNENKHPDFQVESTSNNLSTPLSRTNRMAIRQAPTPSLSKPSTQTFGNLVFSRETLDPRLELLHLHAIHRSSHKNQAQWQEQAFNDYRQKFEFLQVRNQDLNELEIEALTQRNATAIVSWGSQGNGLEKQIPALSSVVAQVDHQTSNNGEYTLVIQAFEHWIDSVTTLQTQRANPRGKVDTKVIEGLGDGWLAEIDSLQTKLVNFADVMLGLAELDIVESEIGRTITAVSEMLKNMLEELDMILGLEKSIVNEENEWIEGSVMSITNNIYEGLCLR